MGEDEISSYNIPCGVCIDCKHCVAYHVKSIGKSSPVTDLDWPRGFQEVKVPRFHDNGTGWW